MTQGSCRGAPAPWWGSLYLERARPFRYQLHLHPSTSFDPQELKLAADAELERGELEVEDPWWEGVDVPADVEASFMAETATLSPSSRPDPNASALRGEASDSDVEDGGRCVCWESVGVLVALEFDRYSKRCFLCSECFDPYSLVATHTLPKPSPAALYHFHRLMQALCALGSLGLLNRFGAAAGVYDDEGEGSSGEGAEESKAGDREPSEGKGDEAL